MSLENFRVLFLYPNLTLSSQTPVAIGMLSAMLHLRGCQIQVFDTTFYNTKTSRHNINKSDLLITKPFNLKDSKILVTNDDVEDNFNSVVTQFNPNLIAVSMTEDTFNLGCSLMKALGSKRPQSIAGGVFPTFSPDLVLNTGLFDMVCIGEGENAIVDVCEALNQGNPPLNIPNILTNATKSNKIEGQIQRNPSTVLLRPVCDLNNLPTARYDDFDSKIFYRPMDGEIRKFITIETHRGCPYTCSFCNSPSQNQMYVESSQGQERFWRAKPVKKVLAELDYLIERWEPEYVYMVSDNFLLYPTKEFEILAKGYMKHRLPFWFNTRAETITKEKMMMVREMNCVRMNIGIEHGNEEFRRQMLKRDINNTEIVRAFEIASTSNIPIVANNIVGFPDETRDLIMDTIKLNIQLKHLIHETGAFIYSPYRGTSLRDYAVARGYINDDLIVKGDITENSLLTMPQITKDEIRGLARTFPLYVRLDSMDYPDIKLAESFDDEGNLHYERLRNKYREKQYRINKN